MPKLIQIKTKTSKNQRTKRLKDNVFMIVIITEKHKPTQLHTYAESRLLNEVALDANAVKRKGKD